MIEFLHKFENMIVRALIGMMVLVLLVATIDLGWLIVKDLVEPPLLMLSVAHLLEIFGFFMLVLIGIELLETIRAYLVDHVVHVEIVLEVALIAIARKVIILDMEKYDGLTIIGTAALIVAVAAACFVVKRHIGLKKSDNEDQR
jgi:uncharacterized membrane protein (DUF373 family)